MTGHRAARTGAYWSCRASPTAALVVTTIYLLRVDVTMIR